MFNSYISIQLCIYIEGQHWERGGKGRSILDAPHAKQKLHVLVCWRKKKKMGSWSINPGSQFRTWNLGSLSKLALFGSKFRPSSIFGKSGGEALICWQNKNLLISRIPKLFFFPFLEQYWVCYGIFNTFYLAEVVRQTPENLWSGVPDQ